MSSVLPTWDGKWNTTLFQYDGSVLEGTDIHYGLNFLNKNTVKSEHYKKLLNHFKGQTVSFGGIRDLEKRPIGSLGEWLRDNVTKTEIASYVAPILVHEGYCTRVGNKIKF